MKLVICDAEMEKEDQLVDQLLQSRLATIDRIRASRQEIIVVASLIDRIPNLAGLARTCEVILMFLLCSCVMVLLAVKHHL